MARTCYKIKERTTPRPNKFMEPVKHNDFYIPFIFYSRFIIIHSTLIPLRLAL